MTVTDSSRSKAATHAAGDQKKLYGEKVLVPVELVLHRHHDMRDLCMVIFVPHAHGAGLGSFASKHDSVEISHHDRGQKLPVQRHNMLAEPFVWFGGYESVKTYSR